MPSYARTFGPTWTFRNPRARSSRSAGASDTDTEIVSHLVHAEVRGGKDLASAVRGALAKVHGAYAIAVLSQAEPGRIVVAKHSSPLVLGVGDGESFCASDVPALLPYTRDMIFLEDGEMAVLDAKGIRVETIDGKVR